jgi:hypothetical protein
MSLQNGYKTIISVQKVTHATNRKQKAKDILYQVSRDSNSSSNSNNNSKNEAPTPTKNKSKGKAKTKADSTRKNLRKRAKKT